MTQEAEKEISQKYCYRFGRIAIDLGFIDESKLKDAIMEQMEDESLQRPHRIIGRILFDKGWMTSQQIETVLNTLFERKEAE
ncbi:MAG: hypothetical protein ACE5IH_02025 [Thermodesulfobacteriota bacterium]